MKCNSNDFGLRSRPSVVQKNVIAKKWCTLVDLLYRGVRLWFVRSTLYNTAILLWVIFHSEAPRFSAPFGELGIPT